MIVHFVNAWWFGMVGFGIGYLMSLERPALHRSPARLMLAIFFWPFTLLIPRPRPKFVLKCTADDIADPYADPDYDAPSYDGPAPGRETCPHCGKEFEGFSDLGCEHCDRRVAG